jgi:hypothetical protein
MEKQLASYDPSNGELLGKAPVTPDEQLSKVVLVFTALLMDIGYLPRSGS